MNESELNELKNQLWNEYVTEIEKRLGVNEDDLKENFALMREFWRRSDAAMKDAAKSEITENTPAFRETNELVLNDIEQEEIESNKNLDPIALPIGKEVPMHDGSTIAIADTAKPVITENTPALRGTSELMVNNIVDPEIIYEVESESIALGEQTNQNDIIDIEPIKIHDSSTIAIPLVENTKTIKSESLSSDKLTEKINILKDFGLITEDDTQSEIDEIDNAVHETDIKYKYRPINELVENLDTATPRELGYAYTSLTFALSTGDKDKDLQSNIDKIKSEMERISKEYNHDKRMRNLMDSKGFEYMMELLERTKENEKKQQKNQNKLNDKDYKELPADIFKGMTNSEVFNSEMGGEEQPRPEIIPANIVEEDATELASAYSIKDEKLPDDIFNGSISEAFGEEQPQIKIHQQSNDKDYKELPADIFKGMTNSEVFNSEMGGEEQPRPEIIPASDHKINPSIIESKEELVVEKEHDNKSDTIEESKQIVIDPNEPFAHQKLDMLLKAGFDARIDVDVKADDISKIDPNDPLAEAKRKLLEDAKFNKDKIHKTVIEITNNLDDSIPREMQDDSENATELASAYSIKDEKLPDDIFNGSISEAFGEEQPQIKIHQQSNDKDYKELPADIFKGMTNSEVFNSEMGGEEQPRPEIIPASDHKINPSIIESKEELVVEKEHDNKSDTIEESKQIVIDPNEPFAHQKLDMLLKAGFDARIDVDVKADDISKIDPNDPLAEAKRKLLEDAKFNKDKIHKTVIEITNNLDDSIPREMQDDSENATELASAYSIKDEKLPDDIFNGSISEAFGEEQPQIKIYQQSNDKDYKELPADIFKGMTNSEIFNSEVGGEENSQIEDVSDIWNLSEITEKDAISLHAKAENLNYRINNLAKIDEILSKESLEIVGKARFEDESGNIVPQFFNKNTLEETIDWDSSSFVIPGREVDTILTLVSQKVMTEQLVSKEILSDKDLKKEIDEQFIAHLYMIDINNNLSNNSKNNNKTIDLDAFKSDIKKVSPASYQLGISAIVDNICEFANKLSQKTGYNRGLYKNIIGPIAKIDKMAAGKFSPPKKWSDYAKDVLRMIKDGVKVVLVSATALTIAEISGASGGTSLAVTAGVGALYGTRVYKRWKNARAKSRLSTKLSELAKDKKVIASALLTMLAFSPISSVANSTLNEIKPSPNVYSSGAIVKSKNEITKELFEKLTGKSINIEDIRFYKIFDEKFAKIDKQIQSKNQEIQQILITGNNDLVTVKRPNTGFVSFDQLKKALQNELENESKYTDARIEELNKDIKSLKKDKINLAKEKSSFSSSYFPNTPMSKIDRLEVEKLEIELANPNSPKIAKIENEQLQLHNKIDDVGSLRKTSTSITIASMLGKDKR